MRPSAATRILYWGPGLAGATTSVRRIVRELGDGRPDWSAFTQSVRIDAVAAQGYREFTPLDLVLRPDRSRFFSDAQLRSVDAVDAVILVLDSQIERSEANVCALDYLELALAAKGCRLRHGRVRRAPTFNFDGLEPPPAYREAAIRWKRLLIDGGEAPVREVPVVLQFNKMDLHRGRTKREVIDALAFVDPHPVVIDTCAVDGTGVVAALDAALKLVLRSRDGDPS